MSFGSLKYILELKSKFFETQTEFTRHIFKFFKYFFIFQTLTEFIKQTFLSYKLSSEFLKKYFEGINRILNFKKYLKTLTTI